MDTNGSQTTLDVDIDAVIFNLSQRVAQLTAQLAIKEVTLEHALQRIKELESGSGHVNSVSPAKEVARDSG